MADIARVRFVLGDGRGTLTLGPDGLHLEHPSDSFDVRWPDLVDWSVMERDRGFRLRLHFRERGEFLLDRIGEREVRGAEKVLARHAERRREVLPAGGMFGTSLDFGEEERLLRDRVRACLADGDLPGAVRTLLGAAWKQGAADVHFESTGSGVRVRFRVDGLLREVFAFEREHAEQVFTVLKVNARIVSYQKRTPQEGRLDTFVEEREMELRLSIIPTLLGEKAVVRLLQPGAVLPGLEQLGMPGETVREYRTLLKNRRGLFLFTGPCSSGKTTTIFSSVRYILEESGEALNVSSIEDPIEFRVPGANQMQVDPESGITFAGGIRCLLRQDPDVIVVGEIRDRDTAEAALQAGLLGHTVLATVHAGEPLGLFARLIELGLPPAALSLAMACVINQRLVRKVCPECSEWKTATPEEKSLWEKRFEVPIERTRIGKGCTACRGTGFSGRTGLFEIVPITRVLGDTLRIRGIDPEIRDIIRREAILRFERDGGCKVQEGITSPDEILAKAGWTES